MELNRIEISESKELEKIRIKSIQALMNGMESILGIIGDTQS